MPVLVATLVANPAKAPLSDARLDQIAQGVAGFERPRIDHGDLAALLYAQGIERKGFVEG